jgi:hypothetical protein
MSDTLRCAFCIKQEDLDSAILAGWEPYFWFTDAAGNEHSSEAPACPACTEAHLEADPLDRGDGMQLRAGHEGALR